MGSDDNEGTAKVSLLFKVYLLGDTSSCHDDTYIMYFTVKLIYAHDEYVAFNGLDSAQHALAFSVMIS